MIYELSFFKKINNETHINDKAKKRVIMGLNRIHIKYPYSLYRMSLNIDS